MNDRSLHGQFYDHVGFLEAVERVMLIRTEVRTAGSELFCHRAMAGAQVTPDLMMQQAIQFMGESKRRAWIQWLTRQGPYWTDTRQHGEDDWLEVEDGEIVTESAIAEAAFCRLHNVNRQLVSLEPSRWLRNPIFVKWIKADSSQVTVDLPNYWSVDQVRAAILASPPRFDCWQALEEHVRRSCSAVTFSDDAFDELGGYPFSSAAAERIRVLLDVLNKLKTGFHEDGTPTAERKALYSNYFARKEANFTDSSETEKSEYRAKLTFPHPGRPGEYLFCTWHGKVRWTPPIRIHFSWPIAHDTPLYVVHVGPKITMR